MYCRNCGKEIKNEASFCPYCGAKQAVRTSFETEPKEYNIWCIIGFALSCVSVLIDFRGLCSITGIVLSVIGLQKLKHSNEKGKALAVAGIVIGAVKIVFSTILTILVYHHTFKLFDNLLENFIGNLN